MLEPQRRFDSEELTTIVKLVRDSVYPIEDNKSLPVLLNKQIAWLRGLKDIPVNIKTVMNSITEYDKVLPDEIIQDQYTSGRKDTGILDSLYDLLKTAKKDIDFVFDPKMTNSYKLNNMIKNHINDYFTTRQKRYMRRIVQHIQALIKLDGHPEDMFGDFEQLALEFESKEKPEDKQTPLDDIILIGLSVIPAYIKQEVSTTVEPDFSSNIKTI